MHVIMHVHLPAKLWVEMRGGLNMHTGPHRRAHICVKTCEGLKADIRSQENMIHVMMRVHLVTEVLDQMRSGRIMQTWTHRSAHIRPQLCKAGGADMAGEMDKHTCTPSGQGEGNKIEYTYIYTFYNKIFHSSVVHLQNVHQIISHFNTEIRNKKLFLILL